MVDIYVSIQILTSFSSPGGSVGGPIWLGDLSEFPPGELFGYEYVKDTNMSIFSQGNFGGPIWKSINAWLCMAVEVNKGIEYALADESF
jgi:hypothetical protein